MINKNTPPGTEVICIREIDVSPLWSRPPVELPKVGILYTVREIAECSLNKFTVILLNEIQDTVATYTNGTEYRLGFNAKCFRLIDRQVYEMENGIEIPKSVIEDTRRLAKG